MKKILILASVLGIVFYACQKISQSKNDKTPLDLLSTPNLTQPNIDVQLRWIALGYARLFDNSTYRNLWHNYLASMTYNEDDHANTNPYFVSNNSTDFESEVNDAVDNDYPGNSYDEEVYYAFEYGGCYYYTGLRQVDPDLNNLDYRVTYEPHDTTKPDDSVYGYYVDTTGNIDSTLLTDDNYDDYDVYIVIASGDCDQKPAAAAPDPEKCNENGICEPQAGEDSATCADCRRARVSGEHKLEVIGVKLKEDKHRFDESWIEGKYELGWNWMITSGNTGIITTNRTSESEDEVPLYNTWKRKQIKRCKEDGSKCKGTGTTKECQNGALMYPYFDHYVHSILIHFYEWQMQSLARNGYNFKPQINGNDITFASGLDFDGSFDVRTRKKFGTFHKTQGPDNNGEGVIYIPANSTWTAETINGRDYYVITATAPGCNGDEIEIKLGYWAH